MKCILKLSSGKCRLFCLGLNVLISVIWQERVENTSMEYYSTKYWFSLKLRGEFYGHVPLGVADDCGQRLWQIIGRFNCNLPVVCHDNFQLHAGPRLFRLKGAVFNVWWMCTFICPVLERNFEALPRSILSVKCVNTPLFCNWNFINNKLNYHTRHIGYRWLFASTTPCGRSIPATNGDKTILDEAPPSLESFNPHESQVSIYHNHDSLSRSSIKNTF